MLAQGSQTWEQEGRTWKRISEIIYYFEEGCWKYQLGTRLTVDKSRGGGGCHFVHAMPRTAHALAFFRVLHEVDFTKWRLIIVFGYVPLRTWQQLLARRSSRMQRCVRGSCPSRFPQISQRSCLRLCLLLAVRRERHQYRVNFDRKTASLYPNVFSLLRFMWAFLNWRHSSVWPEFAPNAVFRKTVQ